jgi:hypothetical protein
VRLLVPKAIIAGDVAFQGRKVLQPIPSRIF